MTGSPRRIHIIGGPGSGKTTLARAIASRLKTPCYELDEIGYEGGAGAQRPLDTRLAEVKQIANQDCWVTEGIFLGWTEVLLQKADVIVWLDLPWRIARWRIVTRHLKAELTRKNRHPGWRKLYKFLQWCSTYYNDAVPLNKTKIVGDITENHPTTAYYLTEHRAKLVHCKSPSQVKDFFFNLKVD